MFSVDINKFPLCETNISYKTHPELRLTTSLMMTTAIPFLCKPLIINNHCYLDGGIVVNYPLQICLTETKCNEDEILGFKNYYSTEKKNTKIDIIKNETTLLNYLMYFMRILVKQLHTNNNNPIITNEVKCFVDDVGDIDEWKKCLDDKEQREKFIKKGEAAGFMFEQYKINLKGQ